MILASLGADVVRVISPRRPGIDDDIGWGRVWHRDKRIISTNDDAEVRSLLDAADVALVYGPERDVEARCLGYADVQRSNPSIVYGRCRPSRIASGEIDDFSLLVEARAGFCTQLAGHRPGPIFVDARAASAGTAFLLTSSVLALLTRRAATGAGGWSETSLYDGLLATLGAMIGRSERAAAEIERYWSAGSTFPNFVYRCSDGNLIQVWFGGKGMYKALLEVLADEPSAEGYYTDQVNGALNERAVRWQHVFATEASDTWIGRLRGAGIACEAVLAPGEALLESHLGEIGLAVSDRSSGHCDTMVGSPILIAEVGNGDTVEADPPPGDGAIATNTLGDRGRLNVAGESASTGLLAGVRVVDFSAFVAGPLAAQVLADLGADVMKVEPPEGEAMRAAAYAVAACQRGKRSLALDLRSSDARPVVERLIQWADVILHNFRVGVSQRLGIDEGTVSHLNPRAVYCHASAFGTTGPRALFPGNDALMQAVTGMEHAVGGAANAPLAPSWIPIDIAGGWVAATGILAGLYARAISGRGQHVATSLLGAGMLMQSGVYVRDGRCVRDPELDGRQTGYGPGYRIYEGSDHTWFAVVVRDEEEWRRLRALPEIPALPETYTPIRAGAKLAAARRAEAILEAAFATSTAAEWTARLNGIGLLTELVGDADREAFRRGILDDPLNRQLGRVACFETADWGRFEQIGTLTRCGPGLGGRAPQMIPGVGQQTVEVLTELGFAPDRIDTLIRTKVIHQM
jgi:crotonobetainyl-CoA:carnitine CoA-transferase CaiB-like acyl-CoA transferase